jgi:hypothetical protein
MMNGSGHRRQPATIVGMDPKAHWEHVYQTKDADQVSWYQPHLDVS